MLVFSFFHFANCHIFFPLLCFFSLLKKCVRQLTRDKSSKKMAPRERPRKRCNTRMVAAIDAMKPFGFPNNMVVKTIKELQNVYGEEGWPFIEDSSYKVLLEAILEKVDGKGTSDSKKPAAETSSGTLERACPSVNPCNTTLQTSNGSDCASKVNEALCTPKLANESVEAEGYVRRHVQYPRSTSHSTPPLSHNLPLPDSNSTGKRRPYYGWICSDDDEDLVELRPGPLAEEIENWLSSFREPRKRWDVKPEDI